MILLYKGHWLLVVPEWEQEWPDCDLARCVDVGVEQVSLGTSDKWVWG